MGTHKKNYQQLPPINAKNWRLIIRRVIFDTDSRAGMLFDVLLLIMIALSFLVILLTTVDEINLQYGQFLLKVEWFFTIVFSLEYLTRLIVAKRSFRYAFSFFGIVDFLSIIPTYLSLFFTGSQTLGIIRTFRLARIFRVLELPQYVAGTRIILGALKASWPKITVFLTGVMTIVIVLGTLMYLIESKEGGFTSIPRSIYWAIVTITTVGYGDIAPQTVVGQIIASVMMITGYAILAVPTGIVSVELSQITNEQKKGKRICGNCGVKDHQEDAIYCRGCGQIL